MNEPVDVPAIQLYSKASRSLDCAFGSALCRANVAADKSDNQTAKIDAARIVARLKNAKARAPGTTCCFLRRAAKKPFIFATELGRAFIANLPGGLSHRVARRLLQWPAPIAIKMNKAKPTNTMTPTTIPQAQSKFSCSVRCASALINRSSSACSFGSIG